MQADWSKPRSIIPGWKDSRVSIVVHKGWTGDRKNIKRRSKSSSLYNNTALWRHCRIKSLADKPIRIQKSILLFLNEN